MPHYSDMAKKALIKSYDLFDLVPEKKYDDICLIAANICNTPCAFIALEVDKAEQVLSHYGDFADKIPTISFFSNYTIKQPKEVFVVEDATKDDRFCSNAFVINKPNIVFYAGVAIVDMNETILGTLYVVNNIPQTINEQQKQSLLALSNQIFQLFELRKLKKEALANQEKLLLEKNNLTDILNATRVGTWKWNVQTGDLEINDRWAEIIGYTKEELSPINIHSWYKVVYHEDATISDEQLQKCFNKEIEFYDVECRMVHKNGELIWVHDSGRVVSWTNDGMPLIMTGTHTDISRRKNAEIQLKTITDNIPGVVFRYKLLPNGTDKVLMVSKGSMKLWGYPAELVTENIHLIWERIDSKDLPNQLKSIQKSAEELSFWQYEWRYKHPDGTLRWHKGSGNPTKLDDGSVVWDSIVLDITEEKNAKSTLNEVEHISKTGTWNLNLTTNELFWSDGVYHMLGYEPNEFLVDFEKGISFIHVDDQKTAVETIQNAIQNKSHYNIKIRFICKDGSIKHIQSSGRIITYESDESIKLIGFFQDITEQVEAYLQLKESETLMDEAQKVAQIGSWNFDFRTDKITWSSALYDVFGVDKATFKDTYGSFLNLVIHQDKELVKKTSEYSQKTGEPFNIEYRIITPKGEKRTIEEFGYSEKDTNGNIVRLYGTAQNITQRKTEEAKQEIENAISNIFKEEKSLIKTIEQTLNYLTQFTKFSIAEIWLLNSDKQQLNLVSYTNFTDVSNQFYNNCSSVKTFNKGVGIPGNVWLHEKIIIWDGLQSNEQFYRKDAAIIAGLNAGIGTPLFYNKQFIGALVLLDEKTIEGNELNELYLESIGHYIGAEIKRKEQEEELHLFFATAPEVLVIANQNKHFIKVNPAFCKLLGYSHEELTSQPFTNFIHEDDLQITGEEYTETITGIRQSNNFINRYKTKEGKYRWISWKSSQVFGDDNLVFGYGRDITEMRDLQLLFQNAAQLAKVGSWEMNLKTNELYWSDITKQIHEVEDDFKPTRDTGIAFYKEGESRDTISNAIKYAVATGTAWDVELKIVTAKGNEKWIRAIGEPEFEEGECVRIYGSFQDIHDKKITEIALTKSFEEKNEILESIGDGFFAIDHNWIVLYWNKQAEIILQTQKEDIVGKNLWEIFLDAQETNSFQQYKIALETKQKITFEDYYPTLNKWFEVSAYPTDKGLSVYFKDVSIRKTAEAAIHEINERFEKVTHATNDAIWDWNIVENKVYWGIGYNKLFGIELNDLKPDFEMWKSKIHPQDFERVTSSLQEVLNNKDLTNWQCEYRFLKVDNSYSYVIDRAFVIRNNEKVPVRMVGALTDVTEKLLHTKAIEEQNKMFKEIAWTQSHIVRAPLARILGIVDLMKKGTLQQEEYPEFLKYIFESADELDLIVKEIVTKAQTIASTNEKVYQP